MLINGLSVYRIDVIPNVYYFWFNYINTEPCNIHKVYNNRVYKALRYTEKYRYFIRSVMSDYMNNL